MGLFVKCCDRQIILDSDHYPCRIGRRGFIEADHGAEGDEKTPLGAYKLRFGLYRADRLPAPPSPLTFWPIRKDDGWCDAPDNPAYNRLIRRPSIQTGRPISHEPLWRTDGAYDIILIISHNDSPPVPHKGSAVFIHIAQPDARQTLGCIAVTPDVMVAILPRLYGDMDVVITQ